MLILRFLKVGGSTFTDTGGGRWGGYERSRCDGAEEEKLGWSGGEICLYLVGVEICLCLVEVEMCLC